MSQLNRVFWVRVKQVLLLKLFCSLFDHSPDLRTALPYRSQSLNWGKAGQGWGMRKSSVKCELVEASKYCLGTNISHRNWCDKTLAQRRCLRRCWTGTGTANTAEARVSFASRSETAPVKEESQIHRPASHRLSLCQISVYHPLHLVRQRQTCLRRVSFWDSNLVHHCRVQLSQGSCFDLNRCTIRSLLPTQVSAWRSLNDRTRVSQVRSRSYPASQDRGLGEKSCALARGRTSDCLVFLFCRMSLEYLSIDFR